MNKENLFNPSEAVVCEKTLESQGQVAVAHGNQGNFLPDWVAGHEEGYGSLAAMLFSFFKLFFIEI